MYSATFTLEAITPVFMRGANQSKAEIRAASIKGLMRWWFRALAGSYFGNDVEGLRRAEEYVFGSTNQKSKVVVEVEAPDPEKLDVNGLVDFNRSKGKLRPKIEISLKDVSNRKFPMLDYLFFSIKMYVEDVAKTTLEEILNEHGIRNKFNDEDQVKRIFRSKGLRYPEDINKIFSKKIQERVPTYYPPQTKFNVRIRSYGLIYFKLAIASLWMSSNYSGLGFRGRRGAGSLMVSKIEEIEPQQIRPEVEKLFTNTWEDLKEASAFWREYMEKLYNALSSEHSKEEKSNPILPYPTLSDIIVLEHGETYMNPYEALKSIEEIYAGTLNKSKNCTGRVRYRYEGGVRFVFAERDDKNCEDFSHKVIRNFSDVESTTERRFYFGLPLLYANWRTRVEGYRQRERNQKGSYSRRASPITLTVKKKDGRYVPLVVILPGQFLPGHQGNFVVIKEEKNKTVKQKIVEIIEKGKLFDNDRFVEWLKEEVVAEFKKRNFKVVYEGGVVNA